MCTISLRTPKTAEVIIRTFPTAMVYQRVRLGITWEGSIDLKAAITDKLYSCNPTPHSFSLILSSRDSL